MVADALLDTAEQRPGQAEPPIPLRHRRAGEAERGQARDVVVGRDMRGVAADDLVLRDAAAEALDRVEDRLVLVGRPHAPASILRKPSMSAIVSRAAAGSPNPGVTARRAPGISTATPSR